MSLVDMRNKKEKAAQGFGIPPLAGPGKPGGFLTQKNRSLNFSNFFAKTAFAYNIDIIGTCPCLTPSLRPAPLTDLNKKFKECLSRAWVRHNIVMLTFSFLFPAQGSLPISPSLTFPHRLRRWGLPPLIYEGERESRF